MTETYRLLQDLHREGFRQGPGGEAETERALDLSGLDRAAPLKIADIGCGTGASTLLLARRLNARITAVDLLPGFLEVLMQRAAAQGLTESITPLGCSMTALPFAEQAYDVLWSEGAIYQIGFERGVRDWRRYLKPGGWLAVSEITWLTHTRPLELQQFWEQEYPEIAPASVKLGVLERYGYTPIGYFVLPEHCWLENYYRPMQRRFAAFLERNGHSAEAREIVESETKEIELYEKYKNYFSYGMYIARKQASFP